MHVNKCYDKSTSLLTESNIQNFLSSFMRIELCRKCGTEMVPCEKSNEKCTICKKAIRFSCPNCKHTSAIQFHQHLIKQTSTFAA